MSTTTSALIGTTGATPGVLDGAPAGTWQIDPAHSTVGFSVRHLISRVRGRFDEFAGQLTLAEDPAASSVRAEIAVASVHTGNPIRDEHLRTGDFFDAEQHPTMSFTSTGLRPTAAGWELAGDLTLRGTTRPVRITLEFLGFDPTGLMGEPRVGFAGRTVIRRSEFGVSFGLADGGKIVIGDEVEIILELQAVPA
ncbi:MAG TPA: YceI family protein [Microlunatus sp.]|nr:YceI family protein [Microlunatus sp.]